MVAKLTSLNGDCIAKNKGPKPPWKRTRPHGREISGLTHAHAQRARANKKKLTAATELLTLEFMLLCLFSMRTGAVTCPAFFSFFFKFFCFVFFSMRIFQHASPPTWNILHLYKWTKTNLEFFKFFWKKLFNSPNCKANLGTVELV